MHRRGIKSCISFTIHKRAENICLSPSHGAPLPHSAPALHFQNALQRLAAVCGHRIARCQEGCPPSARPQSKQRQAPLPMRTTLRRLAGAASGKVSVKAAHHSPAALSRAETRAAVHFCPLDARWSTTPHCSALLHQPTTRKEPQSKPRCTSACVTRCSALTNAAVRSGTPFSLWMSQMAANASVILRSSFLLTSSSSHLKF